MGGYTVNPGKASLKKGGHAEHGDTPAAAGLVAVMK
jgi:hypothetical protein